MPLLKTLFKIVFKWIFNIIASVEGTMEPSRNGKYASNGAGPAPREQRAERAADRALNNMKQAIGDFEDSLNRKADRLYETSTATINAEDISDINELRAELAELKADIRNLRRSVASDDETHGETPED